MKKVLLAAAVLVLGTTALSAQTTPWFVGGSALLESVSYQSDAKDNTTAFLIAPEVGYMFNENWGASLQVLFGSNKVGDLKSSAFGAGLSGFYVMKITDKFFYTPTLGVSYLGGKVKETVENVTLEAKVSNIGVGLEFMKFEFRPSCHWGMTASFGSLSYNMENPEGDKNNTNTFGLNVGQAAVGFKYYF